MCTEACVQSWSMSSPVASSLFTHLYGETGHTGRSHTEPSGHWLCQRTGTRSLSQGMRGNEERYAIARNLESCQKAALLQEAHKQVFTHERNSPKDLYITYTHANTFTHVHTHTQNCWSGVNSGYPTDALCPFPPTDIKNLLICQFCKTLADSKSY